MKTRTKRLTLGSALICAGLFIFIGACVTSRGLAALLFMIACASLVTSGIVAMQKEG